MFISEKDFNKLITLTTGHRITFETKRAIHQIVNNIKSSNEDNHDKKMICPDNYCDMHSKSTRFKLTPINPKPCAHSVPHENGATWTSCGTDYCPMCIKI